MNSSIDTLIVTAHPDDETIFFAGLIFSRQSSSIHVVCVTDGGADGQSDSRAEHFQSALLQLGATGEILGLPDIYENRLDISTIQDRLREYRPRKEVFTHGIYGEYGHPHHQDVSFAVHRHFQPEVKVYSPAYNSYPEFTVDLSEDLWQRKFKILSEVYWEETKRFQGFIPCTWQEGFKRLDQAYVEKCYSGLLKGEPIQPTGEPFDPYLIQWIKSPLKRQF